MSLFIGVALVLLAVLLIPALIIGLIWPAKLAKKGVPPPTRKKIAGYGVVWFFLLSIIGLIVLPDAGVKKSVTATLEPEKPSATSARKDTQSTIKSDIKPEMVVIPVNGAFLVACQSEDLLNKSLMHAVRNEKTKFAAMLSDMECFNIPPSERYKVLSLGRNTLEFVNITSRDSRGMWTVVEAMKPEK